MRGSKAIISLGKVPVERSDDRVLAVGIINMPGPLTNAGPACICQHNATNTFKSFNEPIPFYRKTHQFRTGSDSEFRICFQSFTYRIFYYGSRTAYVFIG